MFFNFDHRLLENWWNINDYPSISHYSRPATEHPSIQNAWVNQNIKQPTMRLHPAPVHLLDAARALFVATWTPTTGRHTPLFRGKCTGDVMHRWCHARVISCTGDIIHWVMSGISSEFHQFSSNRWSKLKNIRVPDGWNKFCYLETLASTQKKNKFRALYSQSEVDVKESANLPKMTIFDPLRWWACGIMMSSSAILTKWEDSALLNRTKKTKLRLCTVAGSKEWFAVSGSL